MIDVTYTWDGGSLVDSNWSTAANWVGDIVPSAGSNLVFPAGAARPTNNDDFSGTSFYSITIAVRLLLMGNAIGLVNGIAATFTSGNSSIGIGIGLLATQVVDVAAGGTLSVLGSISGTGFGLTKTGDGTLSLGGRATTPARRA